MNIYDFAIQMEKDGEAYYRELGERSKQEGLKYIFTLLADEEKELCNLFGIWQLKKFMGKEYMGVVRSTFIIAPDGKIAAVWSKVKVKGHVDEVKAKLEELQA